MGSSTPIRNDTEMQELNFTPIPKAGKSRVRKKPTRTQDEEMTPIARRKTKRPTKASQRLIEKDEEVLVRQKKADTTSKPSKYQNDENCNLDSRLTKTHNRNL